MSPLKEDSKNALVVSIIYIAISTLMLYSIYPKDPFVFEGMHDNLIYTILSLLVIPGQLLSFGIRYGGVDSMYTELLLVGISQIVNILIWWRIILYVKRK